MSQSQSQSQPRVQVVVSLSPDTAIVNYKGKTDFHKSDSPQYKMLKEILSTHRNDKEKCNGELVKFVEDFRTEKKSNVQPRNVDYRVSNEGVYINSEEGETLLPKVLGERLLEFVKEGLPTEPIVKFCKRWSLNPNYSRCRLFDLMEHNHHPLLPDGRFLAWKRVKKNGDGKLVDIRTGTFDNSVGQTPRMNRNEVDEDCNQPCRPGLHVSSYKYALNHYMGGDGVLIEVAVDPENVIAVPKDYNNQKMRVCSYEVLAVCEEENKENLAKHTGDFALDPNDEDVCDDCGQDIDFCECDNSDPNLDDDDDWYCDNCSAHLDDCCCDEDEEIED